MPDLPPVTVTPPPPTVSPGSYAGGALVTGFLATTLKMIDPAWTMEQATAIAALIVMAVGGVHMLLQWWLGWRYPTAPPLPDVLRNP
jgi:hypothetical protein